MLISIVIPVFNAERTIGALCGAIIAELRDDFELEIVLVNDYSRDGSERACLEVQAEHPDVVTYLKLSRNFGEHNAVMAGLHHARGEYVVTMDDDLQNPPAEVRKLLAEIQKGYDIVYAQYLSRRDNLMRRTASRVHGFLARVFLHKPDTITLSTFRVMNRFLRDEIIKHEGPLPYIDAIVLRMTASIGSVTVRHDARRSGRTNYTLARLFALWSNAVVSYSMIPLRVIGAVGLFFVLLALADAGRLLHDTLVLAQDEPSDFERLTTVTVFFRGLQLMATALVGEYVGRVYLSLNRDPQFVVRTFRPATPADGHTARGSRGQAP